jgi:hypothetical protein
MLFGNPGPSCKMRKHLALLLNNDSRKKVLTIYETLDSRYPLWKRIWDCIRTHAVSGTVFVWCISEGPGVFKDCSKCDRALNMWLCKLLFPEKNFDSWTHGLPPGVNVDVSRLASVIETLSSVPRPPCGSSRCSQLKPGLKNKYVTTLRLRFTDAYMVIDFYSVYASA